MLKLRRAEHRDEHARRAWRLPPRASPPSEITRPRRHLGVGALDLRRALRLAPGRGRALRGRRTTAASVPCGCSCSDASTKCSHSVRLSDLLMQESAGARARWPVAGAGRRLAAVSRSPSCRADAPARCASSAPSATIARCCDAVRRTPPSLMAGAVARGRGLAVDAMPRAATSTMRSGSCVISGDALGILVAQRDALDDRTPSEVLRALLHRMQKDRNVDVELHRAGRAAVQCAVERVSRRVHVARARHAGAARRAESARVFRRPDSGDDPGGAPRCAARW